jgi:outer membrane protein
LKQKFSVLLVLASVLPALAQTAATAPAAANAPAKIGIIHIQDAIISTKDGQKAASDLQARFNPKKTEIDKRQADIAAMQDQYRKGAATMSDDAKQKMMRDIDAATKSLNRETEDAQSELDQAQNKIMQELGTKVMAVLSKYAQEKGFTVILDVSNPQTSTVLWASSGIDITNEIVALYDKANPPAAGASAAPAKTAAPPVTPTTARPAAATPPPAARPTGSTAPTGLPKQ